MGRVKFFIGKTAVILAILFLFMSCDLTLLRPCAQEAARAADQALSVTDYMLQFSGDSGNGEGIKYDYIEIARAGYTVREGDSLEYQIMTDAPADMALGAGIEVVFTDGTFLRDDPDVVDLQGRRIHPADDVSYANGTWTTRSFTLPAKYTGKTVQSVQAAIYLTEGNSCRNFSVYFDNIAFRSEDGQAVHWFYLNEERVGSKLVLHSGNARYGVSCEERIKGDSMAEISGGFGRAVINLDRPQISQLYLRESGGELSARSLINTYAPYNGGYTYLKTADGREYSSKNSEGHTYRILCADDGTENGFAVEGIVLAAADGTRASLVQNWYMTVGEDGKFSWKIENRWSGAFSAVRTGMPALYLGQMGGWATSTPQDSNKVTATLWYDPARIVSEYDFEYENVFNTANAADAFMPDELCQTVIDKNAQSVYKLFTNFQLKTDLVLESNEAYLFRRGGSGGAFTEVGLSLEPHKALERGEGVSETFVMTLWGSDQTKTGYQLNIQLPESEQETEEIAENFYSSLLNGGVIANNSGFDFGNNSDGCIYTGNNWGHGFNIAAGLPAAMSTATHGYDMLSAYRRYVYNTLAAFDPSRHLTVYGYNGIFNGRGLYTDENLQLMIGSGSYYYTTGDIGFVQDVLPYFEEIIDDYFLQNLHEVQDYPGHSLYRHAGLSGGDWYYDAMHYTGYNTYINTVLYKGLLTISDLEKAVGNEEKAQDYAICAAKLREDINAVMWDENAPGGPRYKDWLNENGEAAYYCVDLIQFPAIVYGVADTEQATKILTTIDRRIEVLKQEYGYAEIASLTNYWPIEPKNTMFQWGEYMNGGSIFAVTYHEIVARAKTPGFEESAYRRYRNFMNAYPSEHGYIGTNSANMKGEVSNGGEVYLADMVVVASSMVSGIFGVTLGMEMNVEPHFPESWSGEVKVSFAHMGKAYEMTADASSGTYDLRETGSIGLYGDVFEGESQKTDPLRLEQSGTLVSWDMDELQSPYYNSVSSFHPLKWASYPVNGIANAERNVRTAESEGVRGSNAAYFTGKNEANNPNYLYAVSSFDFGAEDSFTVSVSVKPDSNAYGKDMVVVSKYQNYWISVKPEGKVQVVLYPDGAAAPYILDSVGFSAYDGQWHQLAFTVDRSADRLTLYIDGEENASCAIDPAAAFLYKAAFTVGRWFLFNPGDDFAYIGYVDDIAIDRTALTPQQLQQRAESGSSQACPLYAASAVKTIRRTWQSEICFTSARFEAALNGGTVTAKLEVFRGGELSGSREFVLQDGVTEEIFSGQPLTGDSATLTFEINCGPDNAKTPAVYNYAILPEGVGYPEEETLTYETFGGDNFAALLEAQPLNLKVISAQMVRSGDSATLIVESEYNTDVSAYTLVVATDANFENIVGKYVSSDRRIYVDGLTQGMNYYYAVTATDANGTYAVQGNGEPICVNKDEFAPVISLDGAMIAGGYVGDTITLPQLSAADAEDGPVTVQITITGPGGFKAEGASFVPEAAGDYTILCTAEDSSGNRATSEWTIRVSEKTDTESTGGCSGAGMGASLLLAGTAVATGALLLRRRTHAH